MINSFPLTVAKIAEWKYKIKNEKNNWDFSLIKE